jgi:geranylgeranyl diphosphate synthase, type I
MPDVKQSHIEQAAENTSAKNYLAAALERFQDPIDREIREFVTRADSDPALHDFYGQLAYHFGWADEQLRPASLPPGKRLRPVLMLWSCDLAGAAAGADGDTRATRLHQSLPAAVAVELIHNFSLIHDDIEDRDEFRRHRRTLWSVWGEAQAINTGDGLFCLSHLALWEMAPRGVDPADIGRIAVLLDRTALRLTEGQHLDMAAEAHADMTQERYLAIITRKTAALMRAATEIGGRIGAPATPAIAASLAEFGEAVGIAFQVRDDVLGIWAADALGKTAAGDVRRKKMSLPIIHALTNAGTADRKRLRAIYAERGPATDGEIAEVLGILDATDTRAWCRQELAGYCATARAALDRAAGTVHAATAGEPPEGPVPAAALGAVVDFIAMT